MTFLQYDLDSLVSTGCTMLAFPCSNADLYMVYVTSGRIARFYGRFIAGNDSCRRSAFCTVRLRLLSSQLYLTEIRALRRLVSSILAQYTGQVTAERLGHAFEALMAPSSGLTKSLDRQNRMVFRRNLTNFISSTRGFLHAK